MADCEALRETLRQYRVPHAAAPELVEAHEGGAWKDAAVAASKRVRKRGGLIDDAIQGEAS